MSTKDTSMPWMPALQLGPGESITSFWTGEHEYMTFRRPSPIGSRYSRTGRTKGFLVLTNKRLVFIAGSADGQYFEKQTDVPLGGIIDVSMQGRWRGRRVQVGSGMGNIILHLDGVNDANFNEFKESLEAAAGKPLDLH